MATQNGLVKRIETLEQRLPERGCRTCAARPIFTLGGPTDPCGECGREPVVFTIDIDRTDLRGDAA